MTRLEFTARVLKPAGFAAALGPLAWLLWRGVVAGDLGADPVKTIQVTTGLATLILLFCTLAITPVRRLTRWHELVRLRRMLGLWAFAYAALHAATYFVFDQSLDPRLIWDDTVEHPRIAVGFAAFLLLIPLALTSTDGWVRRLRKNWTRLHRLVYPATALGVLHLLMVQKLEFRVGLGYAVSFAVLLAARLFVASRGRAPASPAPVLVPPRPVEAADWPRAEHEGRVDG